MSERRYELGSVEWITAIHAIIRDLMQGADLDGISYSSSEEYLDPPPHLAINGRSGWHMIVADGQLRLGVGPLDTAERRVIADYQFIRPLASISYADNPDGEARVRDEAIAGAAKGLLRAHGERSASSVFPQLAPLHDLVANITMP